MSRAAIAGALAFLAITVAAETRWTVLPGTSKVSLHGRSSIGAWSCKSERIEISAASAGAATFSEMLRAVEAGLVRSAEGETMPLSAAGRSLGFSIIVPVRLFNCGNRTMERDLRNALRQETHPNIVFELVRAHVAKRDGSRTNRAVVTVSGTITAAGQKRAIRTDVKIERAANGTWKLEGALPMKMSDFGIDPPVGLFGLVRAKDQLTVRFSIGLRAVAASLGRL